MALSRYRRSISTEAIPSPLPAERVLQVVGEKLSGLGGHWALAPGPVLQGPGAIIVRLSPHQHLNDYRHVDLEFVLGAGGPSEAVLVDCASGFAPDPHEAIRQAVAFWGDTTASVVLELLEQRGRLATHYRPHAAGGFPGWHAIIGAASGWGIGPDVPAKIQWMATMSPWAQLAPLISDGLDRDVLNGVRVFIGQSSTFQSCEVKINGRLHQAATDALTAMDWPRTEKMTTAKTYLLLIQRAGHRH